MSPEGAWNNLAMLVSVVIPAYNVQAWISETIGSVLQQTYDDLEIILVDDGSTDRTIDVAEEALRGGRLPYHILSQANKGVSAARNRGWRAARGQWIQFLDADDLLHARKVELQIAQKPTHETGDVIYSDWQRLVWNAGAWTAEEEIRAPVVGSDALADILQARNFQQLGSQMFKRGILDAVDGFDESHTLVEDVELCLKIALAKVVFVRVESNGPMFWHRDRPRSLSKSDQLQFIEACLRNAKLVEQYVHANPACSWKTTEAIVDVYYHGARYFAGRDWKRFEKVVSDIEALHPAFV